MMTFKDDLIAVYHHFGMPNPRELSQYIKRCMCYQNKTKKLCHIPRILCIAARINRRTEYNYVSYLQKVFQKLNIMVLPQMNCVEWTTCKRSNTNPDGWNHLPDELGGLVDPNEKPPLF